MSQDKIDSKSPSQLLKERLFRTKESGWHTLSDKADEAFEMAQKYKGLLDGGKNERSFIKRAKEMAESKGYKPFTDQEPLIPGSKVYFENRGKNLLLAHIGESQPDEGFNICASHVDSPRLDLKPNPLSEDSDSQCAYLRTHYYGGIKKYQWTQIPLALTGVVVLKDGTVKEVSIGLSDDDPVFVIPDILPHLSRKIQGEKKSAEIITGEQLNVLFAHRPVEDKEIKESIKLTALAYLHEKHAMIEEDFFSAELEIVPATPARDLGIDRSMILAYGQDDRVCCFANLDALLGLEKTPQKSAIAFLADKEETGSKGSTGMESNFFYHCISKIALARDPSASEVSVREALSLSSALSTDVCAGVNYNFKGVHEINNAARLGYGVNLNKYTGSRGKGGSNDADAEYVARLRKLLDDRGIPWQLSELGKVDEGGGGTVASLLARYCIHTIDLGTPLVGMHAPLEISSKIDVYATVRACRAFYEAF